MQFQYLIFASALCLSLAYPLDHHYYEESHGGYEQLAHHEAQPIHDYGHEHQHQIERISLGEEHGHEVPHYEVEDHHHEHHDEHVDYYVSLGLGWGG